LQSVEDEVCFRVAGDASGPRLWAVNPQPEIRSEALEA